MFPLRDENPTHRVPFFTLILIAVNVVVFLYESSLGPHVEAFINEFSILPVEVTTGQNLPSSTLLPPYASVVTSMFLHGGWGHLLGNMWFLWIFGDNLEDHLGHFRYLIFYLVTGIAAAATHILMNPDSSIPCLGASGAISGILGGYIVLFPRIRVRTLMTLGFYWNIVHVPAVMFLGLWFVLQLIGGAGSGAGIAFGAHIGGFVAGVVLMLLFSKKTPSARIHTYDPARSPRW